MGIFQNQFWTCPSWAWSIFLVSFIFTMVAWALSQYRGNDKTTASLASTTNTDLETAKMIAFAVAAVSLAWAGYNVLRLVSRNDHCLPIGFTKASSRLWPWQSDNRVSEEVFKKRMSEL